MKFNQEKKNNERVEKINGMPTCLGVFYAERLKNCNPCSFIFSVFVVVSKE